MLIAARNAILADGAAPTPPWDYRVKYVESVNGRAYFNPLRVLPNVSETPNVYDPTWVDLWEVVLAVPVVKNQDLKLFGMPYMFGLSEYGGKWRPSWRDNWPTSGLTDISTCNPVMFRGETGKFQLLTADGLIQKWVKTGNFFVRYPDSTWGLSWLGVGAMFSSSGQNIIEQTPGSNRVYGFRRVLFGVPEFSFIPCVKDGVPCLYDEVSGVFCASTSGTPFVAGPRVSDDGGGVGISAN